MARVRVRVFNAQALAEARRLSTDERGRIAREAAADARADAPVRTGEYRDGIGVQVDGNEVRLVDTDPEAIHKEYGTLDTAAHAVLTDAARKRGRYRGWTPR
ncbi:HK97 gp10 family phage protein [Saccharopolyspora sp. NPDC003752]